MLLLKFTDYINKAIYGFMQSFQSENAGAPNIQNNAVPKFNAIYYVTTKAVLQLGYR